MKRLAAILALFFVLSCSYLPSPVDSVDTNKILRSVKLLTGREGNCTTFSINQEERLWMTAGHCVGADMTIMGDTAREKKVDKEIDIAILSTPNVSAPPLSYPLNPPTAGQGVIVVNATSPIAPSFHFGWITDPKVVNENKELGWPYELRTSPTGGPGSSGSPVMLSNTKVVGVHVGGVGRGTFELYSVSVPWDVMIRFAGELWES